MLDESAGEDGRSRAEEPLRAAFERHYGGLLRLCLLLARRRDEAEDIAQESFVRVAPRIDDLDHEAVWPYLRTTALNVWRNRLRRVAAELRALARLGPGREEASGSIEDHDEVRRAVRRLPARQRACLVLRYYEDLSEKETAVAMKCSVGTVKSQTSRALAKLRKELDDGS